MRNPRTSAALQCFLSAFAAAALCTLALGAGSAGAQFGITNFDGAVIQEGGEAATQAGSHPYEASTEFDVATFEEPGFCLPICELPEGGGFKDVVVKLPAGLVGNPRAVGACPNADIITPPFVFAVPPACRTAVIGTTTLRGNADLLPLEAVVYNLEPGPNAPARFGFRALTSAIVLRASIRTGSDYGTTVSILNTNQALPVTGTELRFWGVPGDPNHNAVREGSFEAPVRPFLSNPTSCTGPVLTRLRLNSWQEPNSYHEASFLSHNAAKEPVGIDGCEKVPFDATLGTHVDPGKADSPAALRVKLRVPQNEAPEGLATSPLRKAVITLPQGVSVNSSAASGLEGCSEAQFGLHANEPAHCPDASKVGTAKIATPLLEEPLQGSLYLAEQNANPFGSLLAGYVVAEGHGVILKQAARFDLDPNSGQITASFENFPQLPLSEVELGFFGGPHGVLVNPGSCGDHTYTSTLTSWSGGTVNTTGSYAVDQSCDTGGFNPSLSAGTTNPVAGVYAPFVFNLSRNDGEQNVAAVGASLPKGVAAKIAGVPLCPEPNAVAGTCPAASKIGAVNVATGAGSQPVWVPQPGKAPTAAYLAGPYKGDPYSLVFKLPMQAGPFNLGTVVVRSRVSVDPETAQVSITSDPLPQILQGIPVDYRHIQVGIFRAGFMVNATNCQESAVASTIVSHSGAVVTPASRFQVGDCGGLRFKPRLALRLSGGLARNGHPTLRAVLRTRPDEAGLAGASFALPAGELLDTHHIRALCGRKLAPEHCPRTSRLGYARLWSPLLDHPLEGPIYLREPARGLPDLLADLRADRIRILLHGRTAAPGGHLRISLRALPDVPLSRAVFTLAGGRRGIVVNSEALCAGTRRARAALRAHNGKRRQLRPALRLRGRC